MSKVYLYLSLLGKDLVPARIARDLGVTFDDQLTFNDHIVKTVSLCMSSLAQINRAKQAFDKDLLITIIKSLVFSKMFTVQAYGPTLPLPTSASCRLFRTLLPA